MNGAICAALQNWKTSASSILTAVFGYIAMFPEDFHNNPTLLHLAKYFALGGLVSMGIHSKDARPDPLTDKCDGPSK